MKATSSSRSHHTGTHSYKSVDEDHRRQPHSFQMATIGEPEAFSNLLVQLKMEKYISTKLTLGDILEISAENRQGNKPQKIEDVPWCTLRKIMALDSTARNTLFDTDEEEGKDPFKNLEIKFQDPQNVHFLHPLDVLCVLLHCSDSILQQEIVSKMAMCQFSVPLLLPAGDGSHSTLMLWAMRDIVKKWRPQSLADSKGFREENVVNISMPVISFVRLGKTKLSKSKTLNQVLNPAQQLHNFFIHDNMEGGNFERKISEGLVEMSWYFPSGKSDVFLEPFAVTNLRGDLKSNWDQFTFLSEISSAVFIFMETINEQELQLLSKLSQCDTTFYFVFTPNPGTNIEKETLSILQCLLPVLRSEKEHVIVRSKTENDADIIKKIQSKLKNIIKKCTKNVVLEGLPKFIEKHNFVVDENTNECQKARDLAKRISQGIQDVAQYKKQTLKLQGDLWTQLSKIQKEFCRMKSQGDKNSAEYQSALQKKCNNLYSEQYRHQIPKDIQIFMDALTDLSQKERQYFLKWMKFKLDAIARDNLKKFQSTYKEKCSNTAGRKELQDLDQKLSDCSLGIEHFLRELGQFYEAESSMTKKKQIERNQKKFSKLPGIAAELLLDGFPLELIDGDASNIPLQWITDVLNELDIKTGKKCKIRVVTVLGVQSTGKSTLLNTMFGLQFPVASGRCTRGAFMTLLRVKENLQEKLGCHFILVIDTEGLKAAELASLEDSYEHDNELATLVVGLSNITIVNMAMENATEMKDILQIVVHAFLRMKEIGRKRNCQFVHQNVSDVSAHDKLMRDRKKLLEDLNEMTKVAAKMEKINEISAFTDVIMYDISKDNWYIPGLWQGDPPMAPVNLGYSSNVHDLKMYLFEFMERSEKYINKPFSISEFIAWIKSLWKSVKHEKFIFNFRNILVAKAYNKLSSQYSLWEWDFCKLILNWVISTENDIRNQIGETGEINKHELQKILLEEENKMIASLEKYFENSENADLIERHREEFKLSIRSLRKELERNALSKCHEAVSIQKGKMKIQDNQKKSQTLIEDQISCLLQSYRQNRREVSEKEIQQEFELMWKKTLSDLQLEELKRCNVDHSLLQLLTNDMSSKGPEINKALIKVNVLHQYAKQGVGFCIDDKKHLDHSGKSVLSNLIYRQEHKNKISDLAFSIIQASEEYIKEKISSRDGYNEMYSKELLHIINNILNRKDVKKLSFNTQFELDIKLFIFGKASQAFQKLHDKFIHENDPKLCLEKLKPQYLSTFLSIFHRKDECQSRASQFCELCLKPAIIDYIFKHLGQTIVDEILTENFTFSSRSFFQCTILEELLEDMIFDKYVEYISSYENFTKKWILTYITNKYSRGLALETLLGNILSSIDNKIKSALKNESCLKENSVSSFLKQFCELLKTDLVIPEKEIKVITFQNSGNVMQFSAEIDHFLTGTQQQIQSELRSLDIQSVLSRVIVKPQDELFRKVVGCGKQCPFCKVPCEAGGGDHTNHAASIHRPKGLGRYHFVKDEKLVIDICSTAVISNSTFRNTDTEWKDHPYKEYRTYYPDWAIQPDSSIESSDYWKFIFVKFNQQFAKEYGAQPAELPDIWMEITREQALGSLKKVFNVN